VVDAVALTYEEIEMFNMTAKTNNMELEDRRDDEYEEEQINMENYNWEDGICLSLHDRSKTWDWLKFKPQLLKSSDYDGIVFQKFDKIFENIQPKQDYATWDGNLFIHKNVQTNLIHENYSHVNFFLSKDTNHMPGEIVFVKETDKRKNLKIVAIVSKICFVRNEFVSRIIPLINFMKEDCNYDVKTKIFSPLNDVILNNPLFKHSLYIQFNDTYGNIECGDILVQINDSNIMNMEIYNEQTNKNDTFETFLMYNDKKEIMITVARLVDEELNKYTFLNYTINTEVFYKEIKNNIYFDPTFDNINPQTYKFSSDLADIFVSRDNFNETLEDYIDNPNIMINNLMIES
jgi:hypothetical protein